MKYRVVVNGVSFYTSAAAIKRGVGDFSSINCVVRLCAEEMETSKSVGFGKTYSFYDNKMNRTTYDVQISKVK